MWLKVDCAQLRTMNTGGQDINRQYLDIRSECFTVCNKFLDQHLTASHSYIPLPHDRKANDGLAWNCSCTHTLQQFHVKPFPTLSATTSVQSSSSSAPSTNSIVCLFHSAAILPPILSLLALDGHHHFAGATIISVLIEINTLPGPKSQASMLNGYCETHSHHGGLHAPILIRSSDTAWDNMLETATQENSAACIGVSTLTDLAVCWHVIKALVQMPAGTLL